MRVHGVRIWDHLPCSAVERDHQKVEFTLLGGAIGAVGRHRLGRAIQLNSLIGEGAARRRLERGHGAGLAGGGGRGSR